MKKVAGIASLVLFVFIFFAVEQENSVKTQAPETVTKVIEYSFSIY